MGVREGTIGVPRAAMRRVWFVFLAAIVAFGVTIGVLVAAWPTVSVPGRSVGAPGRVESVHRGHPPTDGGGHEFPTTGPHGPHQWPKIGSISVGP